MAAQTMNNFNPYESSSTLRHTGAQRRAVRSTFRWVITGSLLAAAVPVALGAYGLHRESLYAASLPPGTARCGMGALGALMIMFAGGPFCGVMGGAIGWIGCKIWPG